METIIKPMKLDVVVGESSRLIYDQAINYIKSGQAEIAEAVADVKAELTAYTSDKIADFDENASNKTNTFNTNATAKTNSFNTNATAKTNSFNTNATAKTNSFNDNYAEKKGIIDGQIEVAEIAASRANDAAVAADNYSEVAKQWAIGKPIEPTEHSSKYWAEQAANALTGVNNRIDGIEDKIPAVASASNQLADKNYVNSADEELQSQIDAIVSASDVFDIVGTYAALQAYDIASVPVNDIIKVLVDETHNGAATYYRCVENDGVKSWSYIGSEGAYYTKAETNALLNNKQDTLVSGNNIKTINGNSLLGSGNVTISGHVTMTYTAATKTLTWS